MEPLDRDHCLNCDAYRQLRQVEAQLADDILVMQYSDQIHLDFVRAARQGLSPLLDYIRAESEDIEARHEQPSRGIEKEAPWLSPNRLGSSCLWPASPRHDCCSYRELHQGLGRCSVRTYFAVGCCHSKNQQRGPSLPLEGASRYSRPQLV